MNIDTFGIVEQLYKEFNRLSEAKDIVEEWACEAYEGDAYDAMKNLCRLFSISIGWRYDE